MRQLTNSEHALVTGGVVVTEIVCQGTTYYGVSTDPYSWTGGSNTAQYQTIAQKGLNWGNIVGDVISHLLNGAFDFFLNRPNKENIINSQLNPANIVESFKDADGNRYWVTTDDVVFVDVNNNGKADAKFTVDGSGNVYWDLGDGAGWRSLSNN